MENYPRLLSLPGERRGVSPTWLRPTFCELPRRAYDCKLTPGTKAHAAYGADVVSERHRHRYEFNNDYRERFRERGMIVSGTSPDGGLVEVVEISRHPWFLAVQCHPEFKSKPNKAHPLLRAFVHAGLEYRMERKGDGGRARIVQAVAS